jgi:hypothetical protein
MANVKSVRAEQQANDDSPKNSMDAGRSIKINPLNENADLSICNRVEESSKETRVSELQHEKHDSPMNSSDAGR